MQKTSSFLLLGCLLTAAAFAATGASMAGCGSSGGGGGGTTGSGGGSGGSATSGGDCFDYSSFDGTTPTVHFAADVLPIFRLSCGLSMSCHGDESGPGGQHYLGPANSAPTPTAAQIMEIFSQSVGAASVADPDMKVIAAGDPAHSFMMYKLDGDPGAADPSDQVSCSTLTCASDKSCISSMPQGGPQLPIDKRNTIRRWIAQGAKND
jgi:hypothetical protein